MLFFEFRASNKIEMWTCLTTVYQSISDDFMLINIAVLCGCLMAFVFPMILVICSESNELCCYCAGILNLLWLDLSYAYA